MKEVRRETVLTLAAAHALVKLDDGTIVGDPMERTTLDAMGWTLGNPSVSGDPVTPSKNDAPHGTKLMVRRRFHFSSALKRMSTVSALPSGELIGAVKGAPETIKAMLTVVPEHYDETYKWFTRRGSRVLALGFKQMRALPAAAVHKSSFTLEYPTTDLCTD